MVLWWYANVISTTQSLGVALPVACYFWFILTPHSLQRAGQSGLVGSHLNDPTPSMMEPLPAHDNIPGDYMLDMLGDFDVGSSPERSVRMSKTVDVRGK